MRTFEAGAVRRNRALLLWTALLQWGVTVACLGVPGLTDDFAGPSPDLRRVTMQGARNWDADWSPDGATLIFASDRAGAWQSGVDWAGFDLYTVSAATGETSEVPAHAVVNPAGWDGYPRYAPDGLKIAFERGLGSSQPGIWAAAAAGTGEFQVTTGGNQPSWSPDGARLVVTHDDDLWIAIADGSGIMTPLLQRPGTDWHPAWSPDGLRVAFVSDYDGEWALWLVNHDGDGARKLTPCDPYAEPDWRPDGGEIAFGGPDNKLWAISPQDPGDKSTLHQITTGSGRDTDPSWSPDGQWLAFTSNRAGSDDLWIVAADGEFVLHDDFNDNARSEIWYQAQPSPAGPSIAEAGQRLEILASAEADAFAFYVSRQWRLSTGADFAVQVDWHLTKEGAGDAEVLLSLFTDLRGQVGHPTSVEVDAVYSGDSRFEIEPKWGDGVGRATGAPRATANGTFYLSYESGLDRLYVSVNGYWRTASANGDWVLDGIVRGAWGADQVGVALGGEASGGAVLASGDAYLDNFTVNEGVLVTPSTHTLTVNSTPNPDLAIEVRPDENGAPSATLNPPFSRVYDEGIPVFLIAPTDDGHGNAFSEWRCAGSLVTRNLWTELSLNTNQTWTAVYGEAGPHYTLSGYVKQGETGVEGVEMIGLPDTPKTDATGFYSASLNAGWTGTVTPWMTGLGFTPAARSYSNLAESAANQDYAAVPGIEIGQTLDGVISEPREVDSYAFTARAGQALVLDVDARALGSTLDTAIILYGPDGSVVGQDDDGGDLAGCYEIGFQLSARRQGLAVPSEFSYHASVQPFDSRLYFTAPTSGRYRVDLGGYGRIVEGGDSEYYGDNAFYRLRLLPAAALPDTKPVAVSLLTPGFTNEPLSFLAWNDQGFSGTSYELAGTMPSQAELEGRFPDGTYTVRVDYGDGDVRQRNFVLGGSWPDFPTLTAPTDHAVGVTIPVRVQWNPLQWPSAAGNGSAVAEVMLACSATPVGEEEWGQDYDDPTVVDSVTVPAEQTQPGLTYRAEIEFRGHSAQPLPEPGLDIQKARRTYVEFTTREPLPVAPDGPFQAFMDTADRGWWDLTGSATSLGAEGLTLDLLHDATGRLSGTGILPVDTGHGVVRVPLLVRGSARGVGGALVVILALRGAAPASAITVALSLNLTLNPAARQLSGTVFGSVKEGASSTRVSQPVTLAIAPCMSGAWTLHFDLVQGRRDLNGSARLTLSNTTEYAFVVRGRTRGAKAVLSLTGAPASPGSKAIQIRTTITALEGGRARLESFSARGYGQTMAW
jgi:TolB protein